MVALLYKIIHTNKQYNQYCNRLEELTSKKKRSRADQDEIDLLELLINKYDEENDPLADADPVTLLKSLMKEHQLKAADLARLLNVSEGLVSDMLHYRKGFSKKTIQVLSRHFKLRQDAFNREYALNV